MFRLFKKRCNHCGSYNLKKTKEDLKGYGTRVVRISFTCNNCGAASVKTKAFKRNES